MTEVVERVIESVPIYLLEADIDTDQIFPGRFLSTLTRKGLGEFAFRDRRDAGENLFEAPSGILVGGPNFGCGSSREHAVWALADLGIEAVLAPSFSDIFAGNAAKNGLAAIMVDLDFLEQCRSLAGEPVRIDLAAMEVVCGELRASIELDPFARELLLTRSDTLDFILERDAALADFERAFDQEFPAPREQG